MDFTVAFHTHLEGTWITVCSFLVAPPSTRTHSFPDAPTSAFVSLFLNLESMSERKYVIFLFPKSALFHLM